ncbi:MAG: hypothetical protein R3C24_01705 [Cyanobacteriota/Melainabacteria group bacterium]
MAETKERQYPGILRQRPSAQLPANARTVQWAAERYREKLKLPSNRHDPQLQMLFFPAEILQSGIVKCLA